jgi:hypothetical protein
MPKAVTVEIEGISPYSASHQHDTPKFEKERMDEWEARTWRDKLNTDEKGMAVIPAMAFKQALDRCAKVLSIQVPGKGKATFTKHFLSGCLCENDARLGIHRDDVASVTINANADGVRGSGKRVKRTFPMIPKWKTAVRFIILDDTITKEVFERVMAEAGKFVGVGRFRPENGGLNGRFKVNGFKWETF